LRVLPILLEDLKRQYNQLKSDLFHPQAKSGFGGRLFLWQQQQPESRLDLVR